MSEAIPRHYYRVHFVCQPGGSRKTEYHVLGTLAEVKDTVAEDLNNPEGAYHALLYGEEIAVQYWEDGTRVARVDLHPYISYQLSDRAEPLRFSGEGDAPVEHLSDDEAEALGEALVDGTVTATATVDWERVPLPPPRGEPWPKHEPAPFERGDLWGYGTHNDWDHYID